MDTDAGPGGHWHGASAATDSLTRSEPEPRSPGANGRNPRRCTAQISGSLASATIGFGFVPCRGPRPYYGTDNSSWCRTSNAARGRISNFAPSPRPGPAACRARRPGRQPTPAPASSSSDPDLHGGPPVTKSLKAPAPPFARAFGAARAFPKGFKFNACRHAPTPPPSG